VAIKIKIPAKKLTTKAGRIGLIRAAVAAGIVVVTLFFIIFAYYYVKYDRIIEGKMRGQIFTNSAKIYARPKVVAAGDRLDADAIAGELRKAGYIDKSAGDSPMGTYKLVRGGIEIYPGPESFHNSDGALIRTSGGAITSITATANGSTLDGYELEPQLVTALFEGEQRTKRQLITFNDVPPVLLNAIISIEDRKFFTHSGINYISLAGSLVADIRGTGIRRGGSTITMQLARGFFLTPEKKLKRKLTEMLIAIELEQKLTKQQIFELYANQIYMGQRGSFSINGLAEAARVYFGKDIKSLTIPEAATLAGIIQSPNWWNPYKRPEKVLERRNIVIETMAETGAITRDEADKAKATPLKLAPPNVEASDAPYFVDLLKDTLAAKYNDLNENAYRVYTSIDPDLQHAAAEAVEVGIKLVDEEVQKQRMRKVKGGKPGETKTLPGPTPQVALVALDPHTGEVLALVGGRNYGFSQLNHAIAKRPTGSIFKPFVFATAMNTGLSEASIEQAYTPVSLIDDSPTTFTFDDKVYEPRNYKNEFYGQVTARFALQKSLNNATVKMAEMVGFDKVADLAKQAGIGSVKATPAAALGAYDASPLEMAGAYTVFANAGTRIDPIMIRSVRSSQGEVVEDFKTSSKPVLDPRVAYVMTSMMQNVVDHGTGFTVRARGFYPPAAGKTGTSHDAWFAGYTTNLLCIVWVGYDDYSDLKLAGGATAAPIWAEFMKRAVALPEYRNPGEFPQPSGVIDVQLDKNTNLLATASCPDSYSAAFVLGTEPKTTCDQGSPNLLQKVLGITPGSANPAFTPPSNVQPSKPVVPPPKPRQTTRQAQTTPSPNQTPAQQPEKKKGFWGKLAGVFKGDSENQSGDKEKGNK
jgi:penicillin-binding protein 1B